MSVIDPATLNAYQKLALNDFGLAFLGEPATYKNYVSVIPSSEKVTLFEWVGGLPRVKEWIGDRQIEQFNKYNYTIVAKDWEDTIEIPGFRALMKSETALAANIKMKSSMLGQQFAIDYPNDMIGELIEDGTSNTAYDGIAFFSNVSGARVNDNLLAGTGTTAAQIQADIVSARKAMGAFVDDKGRKMKIKGMHAIIPPELEMTFREICVNVNPNDSTNKPFLGAISFSVNSDLTDVNDWYLTVAPNYPVKPFVFASVVDPIIDTYDDVFAHNRMVIGGYACGNVGYSLPFLCAKIVNS